jgi:chaperonin cofactor prefoldin
MKTVAEIAAEVNVSVQTVYRRLTRVKQKSNEILTEKIDGITYFTDVGEILIIESLTSVKQSFNTVKHPESDEILFLREQVKILNAQIDKLTETIKIQAQSINAAHHNELAETIIESLPPGEISPAPVKVGFWSKLFKRKG